MGDEREKLLAEAAEHRFTVGPDMGVCAADGVSDSPLGAVLRAEADLVQRLAAALRSVPPVETVNTVEELDALPVETVVRGADGDVCVLMYVKFSDQSTDIRWRSPGWEGVFTAPDIALPARVLHRPDTEGSG